MLLNLSHLFALTLAGFAALAATTQATTKCESYDGKLLPIFFFHGVTSYPKAGDNLKANMTAEGRTFTELSFCPGECSLGELNNQIQLAVTQIREIIANDTETYANGYVFVGHSQGGLISRAVIEEMDDHNVKTYISLAGAQNGLFNGPQESDKIPEDLFINYFGPLVISESLFSFSSYTGDKLYGQIQYDYEELIYTHSELQQLSIVQMCRSPIEERFVGTNTFLPFYNNLNICGEGNTTCEDEKERRKNNFLRVNAAHFFGSSADDIVSPWEVEIMGHYSYLDTPEEIITDFYNMTILDMTETEEYINDTWGLRTLDERGGLFLHSVEDVAHGCWLADATPYEGTVECKWEPIYSEHVYPILMAASMM